MDSPLRFEPFLRPMVWGGRRLETILHKPLPTAAAYGESWEVSDHPLHRSIVASRGAAGRSLRDLMECQREGLLGRAATRYAVFPWLVKFLDASDWLSVQVHPDEEAVRRLWPGEGSKTEAWFIVDAAPGSRIYAGLRPGIDEKSLRAAIAAGSVAECLHRFEPRPGDCVFLPAGTVHAVGGGVLIAEVQQTSDATFRLFDWNRRDSHGRPRPLHVEEGLASIHWEQGPVEPVRAAGFEAPPDAAPSPDTWRQRLVSCRYFDLDYVSSGRSFECGGGRLQVLIVLGGRGQLLAPTAEEEVTTGQVWVLPAGLPRAHCRASGSLSALLCTLPDE
jgi:mannose-6-phosphate isomerase